MSGRFSDSYLPKPDFVTARMSGVGARGRDDAEAALAAMSSAQGTLHVANLERRLDRLCRRLDKFDRAAILEAVGGLLTDPALHSNTVRLEALAHLAALRCQGRTVATAAQVREWLNVVLGKDAASHAEDPPEDVFVGNVMSGAGNARVFEGIWEANTAYTQGCIFALTHLIRAEGEWAQRCLAQCQALLRLSDAIAERAGLARYSEGGGRRRAAISFPSARLLALGARVRFTSSDLQMFGIDRADLEPFLFQEGDREGLRKHPIGWTSLERRPLIADGTDIIVSLPTAIGNAVRRYAIDNVGAADAIEHFTDALTIYQFEHGAARGCRVLGMTPLAPPERDGRITHQRFRFDSGAYAHVVLVQDDVAAIVDKGFQSVAIASHESAVLTKRVAAELAAQPDYRLGMTILIYGGLGRGMAAAAGELPDGWVFFGLNHDDFELLSWDSDTTALRLYRLERESDRLSDDGTRILNINGFINLYGYADAEDFQLVPDNAAPGSTQLYLSTDYTAPVRVRLRQTLDRHVVPAARRSVWSEVHRHSTQSFFTDMRRSPLYVSPGDVMGGRLAAYVEISGCGWWLSTERLSGSDVDHLDYQMWDMARQWLTVVAQALNGAGFRPNRRLIDIEIVFADLDGIQQALSEHTLTPKPPRVEVDGDHSRITIHCDQAFISAFAMAENVGDRWMVEAIVRGVAILTGQAVEPLVEQVTNVVIRDTSARYLHIFSARSAADALMAHMGTERPRFVLPELRAITEFRLAHRCDAPTKVALTGRDATALLNRAVEQQWLRLRERLATLDRRGVIERCLLNHDAIDADRATWRRTAAALMGLHDREDVLREAVHRESNRAEASLCSRVIAEMALCASPVDSGRICSDDDLDHLFADVACLLHMASSSDEIHHGFSQGIRIVANGAFRFDDGFANRVHQPFLTDHSRSQYLLAAEDSAESYEGVPDAESGGSDSDDPRERIDPIFDAAFREEYGVGPIEFDAFSRALALEAIDQKTRLLCLRKTELVTLASSISGIDAAGAQHLIESLCLVPRVRWDDPKPAEASAKDWHPWRFARRLSLLARPIAVLEPGYDPTCLLSPVLFEHSVDYALRAYRGRLPSSFFRTTAMQAWIGRAVDNLGHAFNKIVRDRFVELGLMAEAEFKMTRLGGSAEDGDIDVLAWNGVTGDVYAIECKRLMMDRTPGEIADRIKEYDPDLIDATGKRGPTRRHLDRIAILRANLAPVAAVTGITLDRIVLRSWLVTSEIVPMQFDARIVSAFDTLTAFAELETALRCDNR